MRTSKMTNILTDEEFRRAAARLKASASGVQPERLNAARSVLVKGRSFTEAAGEIGLFTQQIRAVAERLLDQLYPPEWEPVTVTLPPQDMAKILAKRDELLAAR